MPARVRGREPFTMKTWLLRLHRWTALVFALPLIAVIGTDLILSFEPWLVDRAMVPGSLTAAKIETLLAQHDPHAAAAQLAPALARGQLRRRLVGRPQCRHLPRHVRPAGDGRLDLAAPPGAAPPPTARGCLKARCPQSSAIIVSFRLRGIWPG
jgi:hypothetical protein